MPPQNLKLVAQLKSSCAVNFKVFHERMERVRRVLSPRQILKLILWVEDNKAMIEKVAPSWAAHRLKARQQAAVAAAKPAPDSEGPTTGRNQGYA